MDTFDATNNNNEEKTQETQVLIPSPPQYTTIVPPIQNDLDRLELPRRDRSFCIQNGETLSRRPSAIVSAIQKERRSGHIFFELVNCAS